jgi:hypothetical protein
MTSYGPNIGDTNYENIGANGIISKISVQYNFTNASIRYKLIQSDAHPLIRISFGLKLDFRNKNESKIASPSLAKHTPSRRIGELNKYKCTNGREVGLYRISLCFRGTKDTANPEPPSTAFNLSDGALLLQNVGTNVTIIMDQGGSLSLSSSMM